MKLPILSRIANLPPRTRRIVISVLLLYGVELILALVLSASWVKDAPCLLAFADVLRHFAPVIGNFDPIARHPEGVRVFLAITICLLPLKTFLPCMYATYDSQGKVGTPITFMAILEYIVGALLIPWKKCAARFRKAR
jgi:hypothetical protein